VVLPNNTRRALLPAADPDECRSRTAKLTIYDQPPLLGLLSFNILDISLVFILSSDGASGGGAHKNKGLGQAPKLRVAGRWPSQGRCELEGSHKKREEFPRGHLGCCRPATLMLWNANCRLYPS
jgi:hypothetical protein